LLWELSEKAEIKLNPQSRKIPGIISRHVFIVAEISGNHGQNFNMAVRLIREAKRCGVDAVKFQAYTPDTLTIDINNRYFRIKHPRWGNQTLYQLYTKTYTPWKWFKKLKKIAEDLGVIFFATAFDKSAVDFLQEINVPVHKISSFELIDLPLIEYVAKTKKPLMLSTGMANTREIREAITTAKRAGAKDIILLKCVSSYPAQPEEMNLRSIPYMKNKFRLPVGISDHGLEASVSIAAVALGAQVVEKHFTLSRKFKTPDSFFSVEPQELRVLVENIRVAEKAVGKIKFGLTKDEKNNLVFRRSIFAVKDTKKGEIFIPDNIRSIRPGYGLAPKYLRTILGKKAKRMIRMGTPLNWEMFE